MDINIPHKAIEIIHAYEGLRGEKNGKYYPYQGRADKRGVLTIGRGHVLSPSEIQSRKFVSGLTIDEVNELFARDIQSRVKRLLKLIPEHSENEFAAALSFFYNNELAWGPKGSPGRFHRAGNKRAAANAFLLYIKSGKPLKKRLGLWRRRATEALCYLTGKVMISKNSESDAALINSLRNVGIITVSPDKNL